MWMSKTLVVVLVVFSFNSFAEDTDHGGRGTGTGADATKAAADRAVAPGSIRTKDVDLVDKLFPNLGKAFATSVFTSGVRMKETDYLPWSKGLEKATKKPVDETDTSATMAVLFSTIDEKQRDEVVKKVEEARNAELKKVKDDDKRDDLHLGLLDRLFWAGKAIQGIISQKPEAQEFLKKFMGEKLDFKSGDFKAKQDENGDIKKKIDEALAGSPEAKKALRASLNRDALIPFAQNNKEFGAKVIDAVSWKQPGSNAKFIDMVGPGNEPQRLFIGEGPKAVETALAAFKEFGKDKGLGQNALAPSQFDKVAKEWYADASGKIVEGVPRGATSAIGTTATAAAKPAESGGGGGVKSVASSEKFDAKKAETDMNAKCMTCHDIKYQGSTAADFAIMTKPGSGKFLKLPEILNAINSNPKMAKADAGVKASIAAWAAQK